MVYELVLYQFYLLLTYFNYRRSTKHIFLLPETVDRSNRLANTGLAGPPPEKSRNFSGILTLRTESAHGVPAAKPAGEGQLAGAGKDRERMAGILNSIMYAWSCQRLNYGFRFRLRA